MFNSHISFSKFRHLQPHPAQKDPQEVKGAKQPYASSVESIWPRDMCAHMAGSWDIPRIWTVNQAVNQNDWPANEEIPLKSNSNAMRATLSLYLYLCVYPRYCTLFFLLIKTLLICNSAFLCIFVGILSQKAKDKSIGHTPWSSEVMDLGLSLPPPGLNLWLNQALPAAAGQGHLRPCRHWSVCWKLMLYLSEFCYHDILLITTYQFWF